MSETTGIASQLFRTPETFNGWSCTSGMVTDFREGTAIISLEPQIWLRLADFSDDAFKIPSLDDGFVPRQITKEFTFSFIYRSSKRV